MQQILLNSYDVLGTVLGRQIAGKSNYDRYGPCPHQTVD